MLDESGETYWEPETEEDWLQVKLGAMALAESANLLMMENRARDQDQWIRMSEAMADAAMLAFEAAEARDADRIFDLGEVVYETCNNCHTLYWVDDLDRGPGHRARDLSAVGEPRVAPGAARAPG